MDASIRERLAALEHDQWAAWSQDIASTEAITPARLARWHKLWVPYEALTDAQKDQDREWADRVMKILSSQEDQDVMAAAERRIQELEAENSQLLSDLDRAADVAWAVGSVNQSLKAALDHNGQKYDAVRSQLEAADQRIQTLKTLVEGWAKARFDLKAQVDALTAENIALSGLIRDTMARLMNESGRVSHGNTNVLELFEAAVAQVREGRHD